MPPRARRGPGGKKAAAKAAPNAMALGLDGQGDAGAGAVLAPVKTSADLRSFFSGTRQPDGQAPVHDQVLAATGTPSAASTLSWGAPEEHHVPPSQPRHDEDELPPTPLVAPYPGCEIPSPVASVQSEVSAISEKLLNDFNGTMSKHANKLTEIHDTNKVLIKQLEKVVSGSDLEVRSALGQRFARDHPKGSENARLMADFLKGKQAEGMKVNDAKRQWRVDWASRMHAKLTEGKRHDMSWAQVNKEKGTYICFAVMVEKLGYVFDPKGAVRRATSYAEKCVAMRGDWVAFNEMVGELEFFFLEKSFTNIMNEKWSMFEESTGKRQSEAEASADCGSDPQPQPLKKRKIGNGTDPVNNQEPVLKDDCHKTVMSKLTLDANKVKAYLHNTVSGANSLVDAIDHSLEWAWARTPETLGRLKAKKTAIDESLSEFGKSILISELATLKKSTGAAYLELELKKFIAIKAKVADLQSYHATLVRMHKDFVASQQHSS
jgi:hypothetical protein